MFACGCSFKGATMPDAGGPMIAIVDDTAADFLGRVSNGVLASRGAIEPDTYVTGGLHARGFKQLGITKTTSLDALPNLGTSSGEVFGFPVTGNWPQSSNPGNFPFGMGINQSDNFSILFDGEIHLPAGATTLQLQVDDDAVFEIKVAGVPVTIATDVGSGAVTQVVTVPADDWYPIRGAFSEVNQDAHLTLATMVGGTAVPIDGGALRARTTATPGLAMGVCFFSELQVGPFIGYDPGPLDHPVLTPGPSDYNFNNTFSIRYQGQLLIDEDGSYLLGVDIGTDVDDGYRLFVDGRLVANHWLSMPDLRSTPIPLTAGWHALLLDYADNNGGTQIHLSIASPVGADATARALVAADPLRPIVLTGLTNGVGTKNVQVTGGAPAIDYLMQPVPPAGATIDFVDFDYVVGGPRGNATISLAAAGTSVVVPLHAMANETEIGGAPYDYYAYQTEFQGVAADTPWHLSYADSLVNENPQVTAEVMVSHHGGSLMPFAQSVDYISQPHELAGAVALGPVHVTADLGTATLAIQVHTSDDLVAIDNEPWVDVANDAVPAVDLHRYIQYRLQTASDGWQFTTIDRVEIDYVGAP
jgi:hypothetical protein